MPAGNFGHVLVKGHLQQENQGGLLPTSRLDFLMIFPIHFPYLLKVCLPDKMLYCQYINQIEHFSCEFSSKRRIIIALWQNMAEDNDLTGFWFAENQKKEDR